MLEERWAALSKKLEGMEERVAGQFEEISQEIVRTKNTADKGLAEALQQQESISNKVKQINDDLSQELSLVRADTVRVKTFWKDWFSKHRRELELERKTALTLTLEKMESIPEEEAAELPPEKSAVLPKIRAQGTKGHGAVPG